MSLFLVIKFNRIIGLKQNIWQAWAGTKNKEQIISSQKQQNMPSDVIFGYTKGGNSFYCNCAYVMGRGLPVSFINKPKTQPATRDF